MDLLIKKDKAGIAALSFFVALCILYYMTFRLPLNLVSQYLQR